MTIPYIHEFNENLGH